MDFLTKKYWAIVIFVSLILLNVLSLSFLWFERLSPPPPPPGFHNQMTPRFLQNELQLTEKQLHQFGELRRMRFENGRKMGEELRELRRQLAKQILDSSTSEENIRQTLDKLAQAYARRDAQMFEHFREMQQILKPEQRANFKNIIEDALNSGMGMEDGQHPGKMHRGRRFRGGKDRMNPPKN